MSKTTREFKGKKYKQSKEEKKYKMPNKFFGFTSGQHTKVYDRLKDVNGNNDYSKPQELVDRSAIKGEDFIKYGYPHEKRSKKSIKEKIIIEQKDEEINEYKNKEIDGETGL